MIRVTKVYSVKPTFEFHIGQELWFNGLSIHLIIWRKGRKLTFTTRKIYEEYQSAWKVRVKELNEEFARKNGTKENTDS